MNKFYFVIWLIKLLFVHLLSIKELLSSSSNNFLNIEEFEVFDMERNNLFKSGSNVRFFQLYRMVILIRLKLNFI